MEGTTSGYSSRKSMRSLTLVAWCNCVIYGALTDCDCSLLRAYALGYLSSVTPKLVSYVRRLGNKDWTTQQKLQEVRRFLDLV